VAGTFEGIGFNEFSATLCGLFPFSPALFLPFSFLLFTP